MSCLTNFLCLPKAPSPEKDKKKRSRSKSPFSSWRKKKSPTSDDFDDEGGFFGKLCFLLVIRGDGSGMRVLRGLVLVSGDLPTLILPLPLGDNGNPICPISHEAVVRKLQITE